MTNDKECQRPSDEVVELGDTRMRFSVLGDFAVATAGQDITPTPAKLRTILALLAIRAGESVSRNSIIQEIWGEAPPESASGAVHTYIYELRRAFRSSGCGSDVIVTKPNGYTLSSSNADLDFRRFDELLREGTTTARDERRAGSRDALEEASDHLTEALALWRGEPLANVTCGEQLATHAVWLEERRRQALELRLEVDMRLGRGPDLVGELKVLTERYPYHERFHEILMRALAGAGRRSESLDVYRLLRTRMAEEFGLEPSPRLQRLQHALLVGDQRFEPEQPVTRPRMHPTQLPPDVPDLCGRQDVVDQMCRYLTAPHGTTGPVVCLHGMAGVGKSTVAVGVANRLAPHFPGGQIYLDLHDTHAGSTTASTVLGGLLRALGVAEADLPSTVEECVGAFRSLTLDGRVLLVLDGVKPHIPVARLLPAACATIITSRWPMHGIAGARKITLDAFDTEEAMTLLARIAGSERIRAERDVAEGLVDRFGGLPLGVRFLGERLSSAPETTLTQLWSLMVAAGHDAWLADLGRIGFDLSDRLDATYRELNAAERAAVGVLGPFRHGKFTTRDVAEAMAGPVTQAELVLTSLVDASLVHAVGHDERGDPVYALPRLVGRYAMERAERGD
nr:TamI [uncultured bacterium]